MVAEVTLLILLVGLGLFMIDKTVWDAVPSVDKLSSAVGRRQVGGSILRALAGMGFIFALICALYFL
jgi:hypothetical protein